jgi:hypothetical protein
VLVPALIFKIALMCPGFVLFVTVSSYLISNRHRWTKGPHRVQRVRIDRA